MKQVWSFRKYPVSFYSHFLTHFHLLKTSHFMLAPTCFIFVSPEVCLWSPGDVWPHFSCHPCYWRNLFFLVLFEMMGRGNPCVVEWDSKWGHDFSGTEFLTGSEVIKCMCPVTLSNTNSVLHRGHSNEFTWIVLCQETVSLSEKNPVEMQLGGHW